MLGAPLRLAVLVKCLGLGGLLSGCSSEPAPGRGSGGAGGAGGSSASNTSSFIILSGASAQLGITPAPQAYSNCVTCHAAAAQGVTLLAPEIRHAPLTLFNWVTRNGRAGTNMVPAATVSDADLSAIHTWLAGLPRPTTGAELYLDFCGNCHGPTALGGVIPLAVTGGIKAGTIQLVRMGQGTDPAMREHYMPPEGPEQLSDAELGLIADYLGAE